MKRRYAALVLILLLSVSCEQKSPVSPTPPAGPVATPPPVTVASISVEGGASVKGRNATLQLRAMARYSDGTSRDQSNSSIWSTSNTQVATVNAAGLVTSTGYGNVDVTATFQDIKGTASLNVVPLTIELTAISQGSCGRAEFRKDGNILYSQAGCRLNGGRGFNVAVIDRESGELVEPVQNFDTWHAGSSAARSLIDFLNRQATGRLLLIAVGDEAGLTVGATAGCPRDPQPGSTCCQPLGGEIENLRRTLEGLGARQVRQYCYWNSYSLITIKGNNNAESEQLVRVGEAVTRHTLTVQ